MGITIDEAIRRIDEHSHIHQHKEPRAAVYITAAFDVAVETMRKYQKIQEIVRWNNAPSPYYKPDGELFREICEVLEDGNVD